MCILALFQDLYQYVVNKDVVPPFSLYTPHPRCLLSLSQESAVPYDDTLIIVASEDNSYDQTVLDLLSHDKVKHIIVQVLGICMNIV